LAKSADCLLRIQKKLSKAISAVFNQSQLGKRAPYMHDTPILSTAAEPEPYDFSATEKALNEAASRVNGLWIVFISLCVYTFIATYTVTPAMLFREAAVKLPIFNADLPLMVYFVMAPVLILAAHAYLIVLTKGSSERIETYVDALRQSMTTTARRREVRARVNNAIITGNVSAPYGDTYAVAIATGLVAGLTMTPYCP
jgi:hypothetical protein